MSKTEDTRRDADVQGVEEKPAGMKSYLVSNQLPYQGHHTLTSNRSASSDTPIAPV